MSWNYVISSNATHLPTKTCTLAADVSAFVVVIAVAAVAAVLSLLIN